MGKNLKVAVVGCRGIPNVMGGIETHSQNLYPRLYDRGATIKIYARKPYTYPQRYVFKGVMVAPLRSFTCAGVEAFVHTFTAFLHSFISRPDIVHIHAVGPAIFAPLFRLTGAKVIFTHHGEDYNRAKWGWFARAILKTGEFLGTKFSHKVIVISKHIQNLLINNYHAKNTVLIPNGVDIPEKVDSAPYMKKYGLIPKKYFFACGRLVPEKGFDDLIEAWTLADHGDCKLVIAGSAGEGDEYGTNLKAKAESAGVVMTGFITGDELKSLYQEAHCFVLPSHHEGLPIVLLEAMSYDLRIISSDIPANVEVNLPERCYYKVGDKTELSQKVSQLAAT